MVKFTVEVENEPLFKLFEEACAKQSVAINEKIIQCMHEEVHKYLDDLMHKPLMTFEVSERFIKG